MERSAALLLPALFIVTAMPVRAGEPATAQAAALHAATAWVALLDKSDFVAAGGGVSEESLATIPNGTPDEKAHTMGAVLASIGPTSRMGGQHEMTRRLQPDSVRQVTSCGCVIRDGEYFVFTYDLTNTWTNHHMYQATQGTQVLYMLKEHDGSWKAAKIAYHQTGEKHGPAK